MTKNKDEVPSLELALAQLDREYGRGTVLRLGEVSSEPWPSIPTGSWALDKILGIWGFPRGRISELWGLEACGKTTLCLLAIAEAQRLGLKCLYLDLEHCLAVGSLVFDADTSTYTPIEELVKRSEFSVLSLDKNKKTQIRKAVAVPSGVKPILEIDIQGGRTLRVTSEHVIPTSEGFVKAVDLKVGDILYSHLGYPPRFDVLQEEEAEKYRLLGYHIANGSIGDVSIYNADPDVIYDLEKIAFHNGCYIRTDKFSRTFSRGRKVPAYNVTAEVLENLINQGLSIQEMAECLGVHPCTVAIRLNESGLRSSEKLKENIEGLRHKKRDRISIREPLAFDRKGSLWHFLDQFPCFQTYSAERFLPQLDLPELSEVLAGLLVSDGTAVDIRNQHRATLSYSTHSKRLAWDLIGSLARLGVYSVISSTTKKGYSPTYAVNINGVENLKILLRSVRLIGYKGDRIKAALESVRSTNYLVKDHETVLLKIKSIKLETLAIPTYDVQVKDSNYDNQIFLADGIFVHNSLSPHYAQCLGVDVPNLFLSQPSTAEEALNVLLTMIRSGEIKVVVVDSVAALLPAAELEGTIGQSHMALQGRLMSQALRILKGEVDKHDVALIFINQLRATMSMYGPSKTTTGGNALKYYASVRIELAREKDLSATKDGEIYGIRVRAKTVKNKMAAPLRKCSFDLHFGKGIDNFMYLAETGTELGIFRKSGTWLYYNDEEKPIAQGLENLARILASDLDLAEKVKLEINAT